MGKYKLSELFELNMGKTPARNNSEYWDNGTNSWISISDLTNSDKYIETTKETITDSAVHETGIHPINNGTVVMSFKLSVGKVAIVKGLSPMYSNEAIMAFDSKDDLPFLLLNEYVYYLLSSINWDGVGNKAVMGKTLNKRILQETEVFVHDYEEQKEIVAQLDKIDEIIVKRKQQLAKLDELVKARFVEIFGTLDNPTQDFRKATLKDLCHKITDGKHGGCTTEEGTGRYFVGAREIYDDEVHYDTAPEINVVEFDKDYKRCNVEIGDFLIVNTGATIGKSAIATDPRTKHTLLQKSVALLKIKQDLLNPIFLKWCYRVNTKMYMVESASAQPNLLLSKINNTEIYVPDIDFQNQFATFVEQVDKSKAAVQKALGEAQTLFDSLMQQYFN